MNRSGEGIEKEDKVKKFYLMMLLCLLAPNLVFGVLYFLVHSGFNLSFQFVPPESAQFEYWAFRSMLYLFISAFFIFSFVIFLGRKSTHFIPVAFFAAIARAVTLRAIQNSWDIMKPREGPGWNFFVWTMCVFNDYYLHFLFLLLTPIILYIGIALMYQDKTKLPQNINLRFLLGFIVLGIGSYISWGFVNRFGVFFITNFEYFDLKIWIYLLPVGIMLTIMGFLFIFRCETKKEKPIRDRIKLFRAANAIFIFLSIPIFLIYHMILIAIYGTTTLYNNYLFMSILYLIITAFIILLVLFLLTRKPYDLVYVAFFIGIARAITLNALWGGWLEMSRRAGITWSGRYMVYDIAYWGMQFFFSAMIPILVYIGAVLASENTRQISFKKGINFRYLLGLEIMGIFTYITWSLLNEYGIFFIWGLENLTPEIAVWFPPDLWFLGLPWLFWTFPIGIAGIIIGFHFSAR